MGILFIYLKVIVVFKVSAPKRLVQTKQMCELEEANTDIRKRRVRSKSTEEFKVKYHKLQ